MRIALVRHFKVNYNKPAAFMTSEEFSAWVNHYDEAEIMDMEISNDNEWDHCYSSDLPRAIRTAKKLCNCPLTETPLLREVPLAPFVKTKMKLPYLLWNVAGRLASYGSHSSQVESSQQTEKRAGRCREILESSQHQNILVVSHGFFLMALEKDLKNNGYIGKKTRRFKNGDAVIFEKRSEHEY